ncbi:hypothetical protein [Halorussus pelagicus]|uniref:hypothetical protein n=1 Tax=Halorussus pelagicus TaxID=2505977 RepID=UPI000FFC7477|nr:hypothetical protein [Halorussus pelagicus]
MPVPTDSIRSGLNYLKAFLDNEGDIFVIDIGRDDIHSEPLLLTTWDGATSPQDESFAHAVFDPEHMTRSYAPEENIRVTYDDGAAPAGGEYVGEWSSVSVYDVGREYRDYYREESGDFYDPIENPAGKIAETLDFYK